MAGRPPATPLSTSTPTLDQYPRQISKYVTMYQGKARLYFIGLRRGTASLAQRAERRTRDREVPGSKLARAIWFFP